MIAEDRLLNVRRVAKRAAAVLLLVAIALALLLLSIRLADPLFTIPFQGAFYSPVLVVCPEHVEIRQWHELTGSSSSTIPTNCTFQISRDRQQWVESAVGNLPSPSPGKSSWFIKVKQLSDSRQRVDLELRGDGLAGMIYEVSSNRVHPLWSRLTGPLGAVFPFAIFLMLLPTLALARWVLLRALRRA